MTDKVAGMRAECLLRTVTEGGEVSVRPPGLEGGTSREISRNIAGGDTTPPYRGILYSSILLLSGIFRILWFLGILGLLEVASSNFCSPGPGRGGKVRIYLGVYSPPQASTPTTNIAREV